MLWCFSRERELKNARKAIRAFVNELIRIEYRPMSYELYENDIIYIIAIDKKEYDMHRTTLNTISSKIHKKFILGKDIVCMPKEYVSAWDRPLEK